MQKKALRQLRYLLILILVSSSAFSQDTIVMPIERLIHKWKVNDFGDTIDIPMDTAINMIQVYDPSLQYSITSTSLGYVGSACQNNDFWRRSEFDDFIFNRNYVPYTRNGTTRFYTNTRRPFTSLMYLTNSNKPKREEVLRFYHSQNINKNYNFGIHIDIFSTDGQFTSQKTANHVLAYHSSYDNSRYFNYFSVNFNNFKRVENGGIESDTAFFATQTGSKSVPVKLPESAVNSGNRNLNLYMFQGFRYFSLVQKIRGDSVDPSNSFNYKVNYDLNRRYYAENKYFEYYSGDSLFGVFDTLRHHSLKNEAQLVFGNFLYLFKLGASAVHHIQSFDNYVSYMPIATDTTIQSYRKTLQSTSIKLSLSGTTNKFLQWRFTGENYVLGYRAGDVIYRFHGSLKLNDHDDRITGIALFQNITPAYGLNHYNSSRFNWDNDFNRTNTFLFGGVIDSRRFDARIAFHYGVISNLIYFNTAAIPAQMNEPINVVSLSAEKNFKIWKMHSFTRAVVQESDKDNVIHIPTLSLHESFYFEHNVHFKATKGEVLFQTGVDIFYHSAFFADAYSPATSMFYLQNDRKIGNYPFIDYFINLKIKQAIVFLKFAHVAHPMLGYESFTAYNYPVGERAFKIGVRWLFYN